MKITEAKIEEVRGVTEVMKAFEHESNHVLVDIDHSVMTWENLIRSRSGVMFVLWDEDQIIGGLGAILGSDLHFPRRLAVECFWFTRIDKRGHGIKLMKHFEAWAETNGADMIAMIHMEDSMPERLKTLYIRSGYHLVESHYVKDLGGVKCQSYQESLGQ